LLENGASPAQAVEILIGGDKDRADRQMGILDAQGRAASYTGGSCFQWAGGMSGESFAVQGNTLAGAAVIESMARAFETLSGPLTERLLAALAAGEAAGGDRRGGSRPP
jgi:uncharacterized Ntn-hydrolase superfamily protein